MTPNFYYPVTLKDEESCEGCEFIHNYDRIAEHCSMFASYDSITKKRPENCPLIPMGFRRVPRET